MNLRQKCKNPQKAGFRADQRIVQRSIAKKNPPKRVFKRISAA
jgi:hypothetical protein